jgi:hypothetical protein
MPVKFISRRFGDQGRLILAKLLLPILILTTPFLVFLRHHSYCLRCNEVVISIAGLVILAAVCSVIMIMCGSVFSSLALAGLLSFFLDIQFSHSDWVNLYSRTLLVVAALVLCWKLKEKFYVLTTSVFVTFFTVTILQMAMAGSGSSLHFRYRTPNPDAPPRIIHLVLDEHIGIDGIPTDIYSGRATKELMQKFYQTHGFQLYERAYSRYLNTHQSLSQMFNFSANREANGYVGSNKPYRMIMNRYFRLLSKRGYQLKILWPGWIDFCSDPEVRVDECVDYQSSNLRTFGTLEIPTFRKLKVLIGYYLGQSGVIARIRSSQLLFDALGANLPPSLIQWAWMLDLERTRMDSLNSLVAMEDLWRNIILMPRGTALFAHLMIPHYPYVFRSDCSIQPINDDFLWYNRGLLNPKENNTSTSRRLRYDLYFEQLECVYAELGNLFSRMKNARIIDDSIILIHGDHGSRIVIDTPLPAALDAANNEDIKAMFSTVFAMKMPHTRGHFDNSSRSLEQLLAQFVNEARVTEEKFSPVSTEPFVYLSAGEDREYVRVPYHPVTIDR